MDLLLVLFYLIEIKYFTDLVKNFTCDDYYRPFLKPDLKFFNRNLVKISHSYIPQKTFEKISNKFNITKIKFINLKEIPDNCEFICLSQNA